MYCKKCGNYIPNGITKCAHCGWIVGSEVVIDDEKEEIVEEPELEQANKIKFIIDMLAFVTVLGLLIYFVFVNYIEINLNSHLGTALFLGTESAGDGFKPYELFAHLNTVKYLNFVYTYKFVCLLASYILAVLLILKVIRQISQVKRLIYVPTLKFSFFVFGIILASRINTLNTSLYPILIGFALMVLFAIVHLIASYKNNEISSKALAFSITSFIFMYIAIFFANMRNFELANVTLDSYDYIYYLYYFSHNNSINAVPSFTIVVYDVSILYLLCLSYVLLKTQNNRKMSTLPILGIGINVLLIGLIIYNFIALKELEAGFNIYFTFYIFAGMLIITNITSFIANKVNVYDFNSTKVYNL